MLNKINDRAQCTAPVWMETRRFIELSWCGVITNLSFNDVILVEDKVVKACALGDKVSVADVGEMLGVKYFSNEEMKTYFTKDFTLEFIVEETSNKIDGQEIYRLEFNTRPVMDEEEEQEEANELTSDSLFSLDRTFEKNDILFDLSNLKEYVRDNFVDSHSTFIVFDYLDKIYEKVSNLEVK